MEAGRQNLVIVPGCFGPAGTYGGQAIEGM